MKKIFFALIMLLAGFVVQAQLLLLQDPISPVDAKPSDLFKITIQNTNQSIERVLVFGSIIESNSGNTIVTAVSKELDLNLGTNIVNEQIADPSYVFNSNIVTQGGSLPFGNYEFCVRIRKVSGVEDLANSCNEIEVSPISPPILIIPENQSLIEISNPILSWLPVMPTRSGILYDIKVVEILPFQTSFDAINQNLPIFTNAGLDQTSIVYPATAVPLEEGKQYAWKVVARSNQNYFLGESEVWWFYRKNENQELDSVVASDTAFAIMHPIDHNSSTTQLRQGQLLFRYVERYSSGELSFKIFDDNGTRIILNCNKEPILEYSEGKNYFTIDLKNCVNIQSDKVYKLIVTSQNGKSYHLQFMR